MINCDGHEGGIYNKDNSFCVMQCEKRYECAHKPRYPDIPTCDLIYELKTRDGVNEYIIDPYIKYVVEDETGIYTSETGPARILVVID